MLMSLLIVRCVPTQEMMVESLDDFEVIWKGNAKVVHIDTLSKNSQNRMLKVKYRVPR
jgi:hypothetical protein